jgi:predicted transcriptional regulator
MPRTARDVTEAELAVLRVLWDRGPSSVRELVDALGEDAHPPQAATVQKLLERLELKDWVERDRSGGVQRFGATGGRDELIGRRLEGIAADLCEGSITPLISHLVKRERLSAKDRQALRDLIDKLGSESSNPPARKKKRI